MDLKDQLNEDFIRAYKMREEAKVSVLRLVKSAIKNAEIAGKKDLNDQDIIKILKKEAKQRQDSVEQFSRGDRIELAKKEQAEIEIIKNYLPPELSDDDLEVLIDQAIAELGAKDQKEIGNVISLVMKKTQGSADGSKVSAFVRSKLS